jgi:hypothetical protein
MFDKYSSSIKFTRSYLLINITSGKELLYSKLFILYLEKIKFRNVLKCFSSQ